MKPSAAARVTEVETLTPGRGVVISALGITQILGFGSSYYLPAVLAGPIAAETGWSLSAVTAGLSVGLLASGLVAPRIGREIDRHGGRPVLAAGSVLLATGQAMLAVAQTLPFFLVGWLVIGIGMGAGLYDAAFSTLTRLYGAKARRAIAAVTLWGGFASTVCWPLSAALVDAIGWRGTCLVYAALQLGLCLPLHLVLPRVGRSAGPSGGPEPEAVHNGSKPERRRALVILGSVFVLTAAIATTTSVHLLTLLQGHGIDLAAAVALGALIGPSQVAARFAEMTIGVRFHPIWTMLVAIALIAGGLLLLLAGVGWAGVALVLYGAGNGVFSIARGTLPLSLFGPEGYASLLGRLAMPALVASALAPTFGALLLSRGGPDVTVGSLAALALFSVALVVILGVTSVRRAV